MLDYFEVVGFELHEDSISVRLDERNLILKKKSGHTYVRNGFLPESRLTDHLAEKRQNLRLAIRQSISLKMVTVVVKIHSKPPPEAIAVLLRERKQFLPLF